MSTFLRTIEFLSLSLWLGSDVFLSFVVAPGAFRILGSRDQAGAMVGFALWRLPFIRGGWGGVVLLARLLGAPPLARFLWPAAPLGVWVFVLPVVVPHAGMPKMGARRGARG